MTRQIRLLPALVRLRVCREKEEKEEEEKERGREGGREIGREKKIARNIPSLNGISIG